MELPRRCVLAAALLSAASASSNVATEPTVLRSGEFVPLAASSGMLTCPQSLTTQQGLGHCVGIRPLGTAVVDLATGGADVFVQCKAQAKPPQGQSVTYRYPYVNRDPGSGAPVFGAPVTIPQWPGRPGDPMTNFVVWGAAPGQTVYAATFTEDRMHVLRLDNGSHWIELNSWKFSTPPGWAKLSSVALMPRAGGGFRVYTALPAGDSTRSLNQELPHSTWRGSDYFPYAGDGIYRGKLALTGVGAFDVSAQGAASNFTVVTHSGWDGGLMGLRSRYPRNPHE